jgi:hypothetical protein
MRRGRGYGSEIGVYVLPQAAWWAIDVRAQLPDGKQPLFLNMKETKMCRLHSSRIRVRRALGCVL